MADSTPWRCRCGAVELAVTGVPRNGGHIVCYCADCRAFARLTGAADTLDAAGGVALYQTAPEHVEIRRGGEHLHCLRLTRRGPFRWHTACCNTALANTAPKRAIPFSSLLAAGFEEGALGRPVARVNRGPATGKVPKPHGSTLAMAAGVFGRMVRSRLSGGWRRTPFFNADGTPASPPERPDPAALKAAYTPDA